MTMPVRRGTPTSRVPHSPRPPRETVMCSKVPIPILLLAALAWAGPSAMPPGAADGADQAPVRDRDAQAGRGNAVGGVEPGPDDTERPWLGVNVRRMDDALAQRLELKPARRRPEEAIRGLLVNNIVRGGPADEAGIQLHDVIIGVAGADFDGSLERFQAILARHRPGDRLNLETLRDGRVVELSITAARPRPPDEPTEWKYPPDRVLGVWEPAPDGQWTFHVAPLARPVGMAAAGADDEGDPDRIRTQVVVGTTGVLSHTFSKTTEDGVLHVQQNAAGNITVRRERYGEDGPSVVTTTEHDDLDALEAADAEAFDLLSARQVQVRISDPDGSPAKPSAARIEQLADHLQTLRRGDRLDPELRRLIDRTLSQLELQQRAEAMGRDVRDIVAENERLRRRIEQLARDRDDRQSRFNFEETADGAIRVTYSRDGDVVTARFQDEAEMNRRWPAAHQRYRQLLEVVE